MGGGGGPVRCVSGGRSDDGGGGRTLGVPAGRGGVTEAGRIGGGGGRVRGGGGGGTGADSVGASRSRSRVISQSPVCSSASRGGGAISVSESRRGRFELSSPFIAELAKGAPRIHEDSAIRRDGVAARVARTHRRGRAVNEPEATPAEKPAAPSGPKKVLIGVGVGFVALALAYGVGRLQGSQAVGAADDRAEAAAAEREKAEKAVTSEKAVSLQLEARRRLHLALLALDDRNFGIAQQHVAVAAKLIEKSGAPKDGDLGKLGEELAKERLVATEDVGTQRGKLLGWAKRFDAAKPPAEP
jgi:hypothetical protein